jgi:hypothetical protein
MNCHKFLFQFALGKSPSIAFCKLILAHNAINAAQILRLLQLKILHKQNIKKQAKIAGNANKNAKKAAYTAVFSLGNNL